MIRKQAIVWWLAAVLWAAEIFWASSSPSLASNQTRSWLAAMLAEVFNIHLEEQTVRIVALVIRKLMHVAEFAVLAGLVFKALCSQDPKLDSGKVARLALTITILYAASDEFHQIFVMGRGASVVDWGIDAVGALLAVALLQGRIGHRLASSPAGS